MIRKNTKDVQLVYIQAMEETNKHMQPVDLIIYYVKSKSLKVHIKHTLLSLQQHDMLLVDANTDIILPASTPLSIQGYRLGVSGLVLKKDVHVIHPSDDPSSSLCAILDILGQVKWNPQDTSNDIIKHLWQAFLLMMNQIKHLDNGIVFVNATIAKCKEIDTYMVEHYQEHLTLSSLAQHFSMDKYYLAHSFKSYKGMSIINYVTHIRIEKAKQLLVCSTLSIASIAKETGFSSPSYFTQVYVKTQKISPLQYRKEMQYR